MIKKVSYTIDVHNNSFLIYIKKKFEKV